MGSLCPISSLSRTCTSPSCSVGLVGSREPSARMCSLLCLSCPWLSDGASRQLRLGCVPRDATARSQAGEGEERSPPTGSLKEDTWPCFLVCGSRPSGDFPPRPGGRLSKLRGSWLPLLYEEETEAQRQQAEAQVFCEKGRRLVLWPL